LLCSSLGARPQNLLYTRGTFDGGRDRRVGFSERTAEKPEFILIWRLS
jgi:hypothetical protein